MRLVYLSPVPLDSFAQRPHHFVHWAHRRLGAEVLWLDPYPARLPRWQDWYRLKAAGHGSALGPTWRHDAWITRIRVPALPLEPLAAGRGLNQILWRSLLHRLDAVVTQDTWLVIGKPCALALALARRYPESPLVFDVMDNMPAFSHGRSGRWLARVETELARRADWLLTSSRALYDKFTGFPVRRQLVYNGLTPPSLPPLRYIQTDHRPMVLGYVGVMSSWFDWSAILRLAKDHPDCRIRLIGPCEQPPPPLPSNVDLLPPIPQHEVYAALRGFSVGLIPFKINALTDFVDPVKYYEYRAVGLPVLSTCFGEMKHRGASDHVLFIENCPDNAALRQACLQAGDIGQVEAFRLANLWDRRFDGLACFPPHRAPTSDKADRPAEEALASIAT